MIVSERPIGDLVSKVETWNPKTSGDESFDYIDLSSVDKDTKSFASIERHACSEAPSRARQIVATGDVLVATVRPNLNGVAVVNGAQHGMTASTGYCVLRPKQGELDSRYLFHWVKTRVFIQRMINVATGANYPAVSDTKVKASTIPLPPLAEQKWIADILDAADALRAKRRESLELLDMLLQSTFLDMFGDPVTNPMEWEQHRIDEIFDVARGGSPRPIQDYLTDSEDGLNWIMIGDASANSRYITQTKKRIKPEGLNKTRMVHVGDFLLTNSMSFGKPYILKTEGCIHDGWLVLTPKNKRMVADYFYSLLSTEALYREFSRRAAGAVVKNLNTKLVSQVQVAVPTFELQEKFAAFVASVEHQKDSQRAHLAELDALFTSLQSSAFRGDL